MCQFLEGEMCQLNFVFIINNGDEQNKIQLWSAGSILMAVCLLFKKKYIYAHQCIHILFELVR